MSYKGHVLIAILCLLLSSMVMSVVAAAEVDRSKKTPVIKESELKLRLKSLAFEASKAGDIWTAIQAENYAREKLGVRSSGLISNIDIYGDPLFAFPHEIAAYFDRGERLIVAAGRRVYQIAPAGYPLQLSIPLRVYPRFCGITKDSRYLAAIDRRYDPVIFDVSVVDLTDGKEVWGTQVNRGAEDQIVSGLTLSADGQAIGCVVRNESGSHRIQIFEANGRNTPVYGFDRVYAVGNGGRWGIGQKVEKIEETYKKSIVVVKEGDQRTVLDSASGPNGVAAVITPAPDFMFTIIGLDGTFTPVIAPSPFSKTAEVSSTGEWLVAATGEVKGRGKTGEVDLLGNEIIEKDRPNTIYCYRWADLVTPATAKPVHVFAGKSYVSFHNPGKIYIQSDGGLVMHDLDNPLLPPVVIAEPKSFERLSIDRGRLVMTDYKGGARIASLAGETVWEGKASRVDMLDAWHALINDDKRQKLLVHLQTDEAKRKEVVLDMKGLSYRNFAYDMYDRRLVGWNWESKSNWTAFNVEDGSRLEHHMGDKYRPEVPEWGDPYSERKVQMARLVPRNEPRGDDPSRYWNPRDAWRVGNVLIILDHHGQVHISNTRKRGTYMTLGSVDNADRFGFIGGDQLALADREDLAVATFGSGAIIPARPGSKQRVGDMPEGPWRVKGMFYVPPRTSSMLFNASKCGFRPRLFRSPPGGTNVGMLMVTDSVVIEVDAALGRYIGDVDKKGLREK